ncbi:hypothetical protein A0H81_05772 [Grifola frondosa]|uniref:Uncharacterized protein n=1 Tax=Grifola frondosa TaxID=5627 RepID=A0A1C7MI71_GRIFR|nr:hypothetical protein A0H81_05772 [Grifola frondosa]
MSLVARPKYGQIQPNTGAQTSPNPARSSSRLTAPTPRSDRLLAFFPHALAYSSLEHLSEIHTGMARAALLVGAWLEFTSNQAAAR